MITLASRALVLLLTTIALSVTTAPRPAAADDPNEQDGSFVTTWSTASPARVALQLYGAVDVTIDWGDGTTQTVHATRVRGVDGPIAHAYTDGEPAHQVVVLGTFTKLGDPGAALQDKPTGLLTVDDFVATLTTDMASAYDGAAKLTYAASMPFGVTDMSRMFAGTRSFNQQLGSWYREVSSATDMSGLFAGSHFNQPIDTWDVSDVTDMSGMFRDSWFNQPIGTWDVSHVTDMSRMFYRSEFDQGIGLWNVSRVTDMSQMFANTPTFDQPIGSWNVSRVTGMTRMFEQAWAFNRDLSRWCVSSITSRPVGFDDGAASWSLPRPPWGGCAGPDRVAPSGAFTKAIGEGGVLSLEGTATDDVGVRSVAVAIRNPATGLWLHRDGTWGALQKLYTSVAEPGAPSTTWSRRRVISSGTYGVALIVADTSGNKNPAPRPWRTVTVTAN